MHPIHKFLLQALVALGVFALGASSAVAAGHKHRDRPPQVETGFLNRQLVLHGQLHRFQVYVPEQWNPADHRLWPIILFLHGRGERGQEGMWQTQVGLPQAVRAHPERWPFIIVMPQCPQDAFWTDPDSLALAMETLDRESDEFHGDPERTYLTGLSMGGYGAWELIRKHPRRWAAVSIASGGVFWSYAPERWQRVNTLPAEYARALGHTAAWLFHGTEDPVVVPKQDELMFDAIKAEGGRVRLWLYQGLRHDSWTRAFNEPDLPRWLLSHRLEPPTSKQFREPQPYAERTLVPQHPPAIRLTTAQLEALTGEYAEPHSHGVITLLIQADQLLERDTYGQFLPLEAETPNILFYPNGSYYTRLTVERDSQGRVTGILYRDDRLEERWERRLNASPGQALPTHPALFHF